jgi:hypothetical protein
MRDPELVARAQHAAARLESAWERWRALQGLGETPAQPVVGYVGYALKEPWGQPRAVIGFSADEAERLADFLEHGTAAGSSGTGPSAAVQPAAVQPAAVPSTTVPSTTGGQPTAPSFTPSRTTAGQPTLVDLGAERSLRSLRASYRVPRYAPASYQEPVGD